MHSLKKITCERVYYSRQNAVVSKNEDEPERLPTLPNLKTALEEAVIRL